VVGMARSSGRGDYAARRTYRWCCRPTSTNWHHVSQLRWLDRSFVRRILGEGEVGPSAVVVLEVSGEDASQVALAQDEDMVETLSPDRADEAFREGILPRASGSREDFLNLHAPHTLTEGVAVDGVSVAQEVRRGSVVREGRLGIMRETVRSATSIPSLRSSPWIRGAPHSGLAAAIFRTRAMISAFIDGRPTWASSKAWSSYRGNGVGANGAWCLEAR
jgi:hypothetical protein